MMTTRARIDSLLTSRRLPWLLAVTAMLLTLPGLWTGLSVDDLFHREVLTGGDPFGLDRIRPWWDLFNFIDGDPAYGHQLADLGVAPWWLLPEMKAAFFRPVTAASHALDYLLWPEQPLLMHVHSLLWYAALVVTVTLLYRRTIASAWAAGLAAVLYAVDDAHGFPVAWLANRNAVIAALLGVLAIIAHQRWCRDSWRPGAWLGPVLLVLALLANEGAVAVAAYLVAYALCLDSGSWRSRLLRSRIKIPYTSRTTSPGHSDPGFLREILNVTRLRLRSRAGDHGHSDQNLRRESAQGILVRLLRLAPSLLVIIVWRILHHAFGYGTCGSGLYLDPAQEPLQFLMASVERVPLLLLGQWWLAPPQLTLFFPRTVVIAWSAVAVLLLLPIALALLPLLRRDRTARFWAIGMLLSLVPICATFPHDRLLFFVGLGGMGLLAQLLDSLRGGAGRRATRLLAGLLVVVHLVLAPLLLPVSAWSPAIHGRAMEQAARSLGDDPPLTGRDVVMVNGLVPFFASYLPIVRLACGLSAPDHTRVLAPATEALYITRPDRYSLRIRPEHGFLTAPMDDLYRGPAHPMQLGQRVELSGMTVEVTEMTCDSRPAEALFRFDRPLEDASLLWLQDSNGQLQPYTPPEVGETQVLPAQSFIPTKQ